MPQIKLNLDAIDQGHGLMTKYGTIMMNAARDMAMEYAGRAALIEREMIARMVEEYSLQFMPRQADVFSKLEILANAIREKDSDQAEFQACDGCSQTKPSKDLLQVHHNTRGFIKVCTECAKAMGAIT